MEVSMIHRSGKRWTARATSVHAGRTGLVPYPGVTVFLLEYFCDGAAIVAGPWGLFVDIGRVDPAKRFGMSVA